MGSAQYNIDPELLAEFIDESVDSLASLETALVSLEEDPENLDIVNSIFRPIHSLKGNASFFGLMRTKELSHKMENLLDLVRARKKFPTKEVIGAILPGVDLLEEILANVRAGKPEIEDEEIFQEVLGPIEKAAQAETFDIGQILNRVCVSMEGNLEFIPEARLPEYLDILDIIRKALPAHAGPKLADNVVIPQPLRMIFEMLAEPIQDALKPAESEKILNALKTLQGMAEEGDTQEILSRAIDEYETFVEQIGFDPLLRDLILEKAEKLKNNGQWIADQIHHAAMGDDGKPLAAATASPAEAAEPVPPPASDAKAREPEKTMRVSEKRIDDFLSYVGELIVVEEMFSFLQSRLVGVGGEKRVSSEFKRILETFASLSDNLRKSILTIRKVPVRSILQKVPRIVHDIAEKTGKSAQVLLEGESVDIDKSYVDVLDAPLTHMVRNAIDHGIEMPEVRKAAGKTAMGTIVVSVRELENDIELAVRDDGAGLDYDAIREKAIQVGLIEKDRQLTREHIVDFLFEAGVSTAKEVTDISGRGVGMDVVKRNIDSMGGLIFVESERGRGALFRIVLPKNISTQIMNGFLVQCAGNVYVLPMNQIAETFAPQPGDLTTIAGKGEMVSRHGRMLPVIRSRDILALADDKAEQSSGVMVAIDVKGDCRAFLVDNILGVQKVVVKPVAGLELNAEIYQGSAVMGNGSVSMILDPAKLFASLATFEKTSPK